MVISHDRDLLDNASDWILHSAGKLALYRGGYSQFERRAASARRSISSSQKQEAERKAYRLRRPLPRQGDQARPGAVPMSCWRR